MGNLRTHLCRKTIVRVSWGEAGGEQACTGRRAWLAWVLHHDLLLSTLTAEFQRAGNLATPRNSEIR